MKLSVDHCGSQYFIVYINDDLRLNLTYFMARSNLVTETCEWKKLKKMCFLDALLKVKVGKSAYLVAVVLFDRIMHQNLTSMEF